MIVAPMQSFTMIACGTTYMFFSEFIVSLFKEISLSVMNEEAMSRFLHLAAVKSIISIVRLAVLLSTHVLDTCSCRKFPLYC